MKHAILAIMFALASCAAVPVPQRHIKQDVNNTVALTDEIGDVFCSGAIVQGYVLTANHCMVEPFIYVQLEDGTRSLATPVLLLPGQDLAVLKTRIDLGKGFKLARKAPTYGDEIFVVGYPLGAFGKHVTRGVVSNPRQEGGIQEHHLVFYHDAGVQGGNSGGPVLDASGRLVGITSFGILKGVVCPFGCPNAYQDTTLNAATHLDALHQILDQLH